MGAVQLRVACSHVQVAASRAGGALAAATWMAHEPLACVHTSARHSLPFNICLFCRGSCGAARESWLNFPERPGIMKGKSSSLMTTYCMFSGPQHVRAVFQSDHLLISVF